MAEWVDLWPIFEVCENDTGYEGGGRLQEPWWRQATAEKNLRAMLEEISASERDRQR